MKADIRTHTPEKTQVNDDEWLGNTVGDLCHIFPAKLQFTASTFCLWLPFLNVDDLQCCWKWFFIASELEDLRYMGFGMLLTSVTAPEKHVTAVYDCPSRNFDLKLMSHICREWLIRVQSFKNPVAPLKRFTNPFPFKRKCIMFTTAILICHE